MLETKERLVTLWNMYQKGAITGTELMGNVFQMMTEENVEGVFLSLPDYIQDQMIADARIIPANVRIFQLCTCVLPTDRSKEEYQARCMKQQENYHRGLAALKAYAEANNLY